jgi:hypothetical protein
MAALYGRAGRLTSQNGGFRPGQCDKCKKSPPSEEKTAEIELNSYIGCWDLVAKYKVEHPEIQAYVSGSCRGETL